MFGCEIQRLQLIKSTRGTDELNSIVSVYKILFSSKPQGAVNTTLFARPRKSMKDFFLTSSALQNFIESTSRVFVSNQPFASLSLCVARTPLCVVFRSAREFLIRNLCGAAIKREKREKTKRCRASEAQVGMRYAAGRTLTHTQALLGRRSLSRSPCADAISHHFLPVHPPRRVSHRAQIKCGDGSGRCIRACLNCNGWDNVMRCALFSSTDRPDAASSALFQRSYYIFYERVSEWRRETPRDLSAITYIEMLHFLCRGRN